MKNLLIFVCFAFIFQVSAQNSQKLLPKSWRISNIQKVTPVQLEKPNLAPLKAEDAINDMDKSIPWRFGYDHFVNLGLENAGQWDELPNGDRIWRINIISPGALTMNVLFDRYKIPVGGKVHVYNEDHSEILNEYTHAHNNPEEILGTWMVNGESLWIEYFEPKEVKDQGKLNIGNVIHGYRTLKSAGAPGKALNDSGPCNVDVNCNIEASSPIANNVKENVKSAVGMVLVNGGNGFCSGALVNNTNNDGTPYFLTANHCLGGSVAGWAFRFNWESDASVADCATNAPSVDGTFIQTASGATLRATNSESDMALLEILDTPFFTTNNEELVWAGWNRSTTAVPQLTIGVHHPRGDIKKVCVDTNTATREIIDFNGNPSTEIWRIADWDVGVTEPGSSGSPLFDQDGLIIGKLSGGFAACDGTNDNDLEDWYGRFGVSWDFSPNNSEQLKFWLDPAGTNPVSLGQFPAIVVFDNDAAISILNVPDDVCNNNIIPTLRIRNKGINELTNATITYQLDTDTSVTINWTGNLAFGVSEDIPLSAISVTGEGAHSFTASVSTPNGSQDESSFDNNATKNFSIPQEFSATSIRVIITPDRYGEENTWTLEDSNGTIIGSGGPYATTDTNGAQPEEVMEIPITNLNDCYTFTLVDSFGDGMCCSYGEGTYRLEDGAGNILIDGTGSFLTRVSNLFRIVDSAAGGDNLAESLRIYPNPSTGNFTVNIGSSENVIYEIHSVTGQLVQTGAFSQTINTLAMADKAAGVYFIRVIDVTANISVIKKIIRY